jgi:hypothetical protein
VSRPLPTIARLPPTGLNRGTRDLLIKALEGYSSSDVLQAFYAQTWADLADYLDGLDTTSQSEVADAIRASLTQGEARAARALKVLRNMPETDFLDAVERVLAEMHPYHRSEPAARLQAVCQRRGVPYGLAVTDDENVVFEWTGDPIVETEVLVPALSALDDPRLAGGPQKEFVAARAAIREGTPQSHQHAVAMACNAVESGLTVLLREHDQPVPNKPVLGNLLKAARAAELFPTGSNGKSAPIEHVLAAAGHFGNERGRHGAGEEPHDVQPDEAEAVVAAAAVALTLIARRLPPQ